MKKFLQEHGYETVLAVFILLSGGFIIGLFNEVVAAFDAYPVAMAVCCIFFFAVGLIVSTLADRKAALVERVKQDGETERLKLEYERDDIERQRQLKEKEKREAKVHKEQVDECFNDFICELSSDKKAIAAALYQKKDHRVIANDSIVRTIELIDNLYGELCFFTFDKRGEDYTIVSLNGWLIELFDERPELLNNFPKFAIDKAAAVIDGDIEYIPEAIYSF